jgi:hypothetical protein
MSGLCAYVTTSERYVRRLGQTSEAKKGMLPAIQDGAILIARSQFSSMRRIGLSVMPFVLSSAAWLICSNG